jgi:transcription-repair coupling factor (superfamily II helicase)
MHDLQLRLEKGGVLSISGIHPAAQPFFILLLTELLPAKTIIGVSHGVKSQESLQQDLETWFNLRNKNRKEHLLYYPAWEVLPHDSRLPHADIISERLETLVALSKSQSSGSTIVTNVTALMQKTFPAGELERSTRILKKGDRIEPLDLVEWLEDQGYEPEAQVTSKGEIALRGGILDIYPLPSPWPIRLEFFGDE